MKLKISRDQTGNTKGTFSKSTVYSYSLKIVAELTDEEVQLLSKYDYLNEKVEIDPDLSPAIVRSNKKLQGLFMLSLADLQKGVVWTSEGYLSQFFLTIPSSVQAMAQGQLSAALAREVWGGEDVIEVG